MQKIDFKNLPDTNTPFTAENFNQLQTNVENAIADLNIRKLWENPNKNSEFAYQNVTLSSGDYDYLIITYKHYHTYDDNIGYYLSQFIPKGYGFKLIDVGNYGNAGNYDNNACYSRSVARISDTIFEFQSTKVFLSVSPYYVDNANAYLIPMAIYGGKFE